MTMLSSELGKIKRQIESVFFAPAVSSTAMNPNVVNKYKIGIALPDYPFGLYCLVSACGTGQHLNASK